MVAPGDLQAQGVPVYRIQQKPGEFVVTMPRGYASRSRFTCDLGEVDL